MFGVLCPKLLSYGLLTKTVIREADHGTVERIRYEMSDIGNKFHSLIEKVNELQNKK